MIAPVDDVRRVLDGLEYRVVLDVGERLVRQADLGRRRIAEFQPHDFSARRDQPTFHSLIWREDAIAGRARIANGREAKSERKKPRWLATAAKRLSDYLAFLD